MLSLPRAQVQSLVGKLRSYMMHGIAKKQKRLNSVHVCECACVSMHNYACGRWKGIPGRRDCRHTGKKLVWLPPAVRARAGETGHVY